jgi:hypothetical protein
MPTIVCELRNSPESFDCEFRLYFG